MLESIPVEDIVKAEHLSIDHMGTNELEIIADIIIDRYDLVEKANTDIDSLFKEVIRELSMITDDITFGRNDIRLGDKVMLFNRNTVYVMESPGNADEAFFVSETNDPNNGYYIRLSNIMDMAS